MLAQSPESSESPSSAGWADHESGPRRIWLCADDYGIAPGVNAAIRDLIVRGRLNATSVMVAAPSFHRSEAVSLDVLNTGARRVAIGLHVTLSAPFRPLSKSFKPLREGAFLPLPALLARSLARGLHRAALADEIRAQIRMFIHTFGRAPDFIDGHQHVQLFPQVRDALLAAVRQYAPDAWVRQCGRAAPHAGRLNDPKAALLDTLSKGFRQRAAELGVATNPAFAGAYAFTERANFPALFARFLQHLPDGGVIMCHPGFVDAELKRLDPLTTLREREYAFFAGDAFPELLSTQKAALA